MSEVNDNDEVIKIPNEIEWTPSWLTWVGATTSCLKALDVDCDLTEVAGLSGYAFHLCIGRGLCPSGPTVLDWNRLATGIMFAGRSTVVFSSSAMDR